MDFFSGRFGELLGRLHGPLNFRLLVMPTVVTVLAIRAHLKDVRSGKPVFLGAFIRSSTERARLVRSALGDVGKTFVVAVVLDTVYQILVYKSFRPGPAIFVALVCAVLPYVLVRFVFARIVHQLRRPDSGKGTVAPAPEGEAGSPGGGPSK
jgi:hypothetical protein